MKKLLSMLVIVACGLCVFLSGCGGSSSGGPASYEAAFVGTWNAVEVTGETSYTRDQVEMFRSLGFIDIFINLDEGGKAVMSSTTNGKNETAEGTWTADSATQVTLTINGKSTPMTLEDGVLSMASTDSKLLFEKVEHRDPAAVAPTSGNSAAPSNEPSETASPASEPSSEGASSASAVPGSSESAPAQGEASSATSETVQSQAPSSSSSASGARFDVSIDAVEVGADYEGNPALIVTYTWKNNSDETTSYASSLHAKCFQNGVQLETAFVFEGVDSDGYMAEVRPGYGTTFQMAYALQDTENPVEIEVGELFNYKGEPLVSKTFEL